MLDPKFFFGVVEDRKDPLKMGRVRVRVDHYHPDDKNLVPTDSLPWAVVMQWVQSSASRGIGWAPVGPIEGTRVFGLWLDGDDAQIPMVLGTMAGDIGHLTYPSQKSTPSPAQKSSPSTKGGSSAPSPKLGDVGSNRLAGVAQKLQQRYGLTDYQAAGLVGNLAYESGGLVSNRVEGGKVGSPPARGTKLTGYGWAQWTNGRHDPPGAGRLDKYLDFCDSKGLDPQSDEANYQYLCSELDGPQNKTIQALKQTTSLNDATSTTMNVFEKPAAKYAKTSLSSRQAYANKTMKGMTNVNVPVRTAGTDENQSTTAPDDQPKDDVHPAEPPRPPYQGEYPYNKTFRSESGHLVEYDDTPEKERLFQYHKTGTYHEMRANGDRVVKVIGNQYTIVLNDDSIFVEGTANITVKGNINLTCYNDVALNAAGQILVKAAEDLIVHANTISLEADSDFSIKSGGDLNLESEGDLSLKAGGNVAADGTDIYWNSGKSNSADGANAGKKLTGAKVNPTTVSKGEAAVVVAPDDPKSMAAALDAAGIPDSKLAAQALTATDADHTIPSLISPLSKLTNGIENLTTLPSSLGLSTNFTLGQMLNGVNGVQDLVSNRGLNIGQIGANLSLLAQNVLEPIYSRYPNLQIMSSFTPDVTSGATSLHGLGKAATLSFGDITQHFDIASWIKDNVPAYQVILQGKWIHVAYDQGLRNPTGFLQTVQNPASRNPVFESGLIQYWADSENG